MFYGCEYLILLLSKPHIWVVIQTFAKGIILSSLSSLPDSIEGQIVHYDKRFYLTSANRRIVSRASQVIIVPIEVVNTDVETTIYIGSVLSDTIAAGKMYRAQCRGQFSTANDSDTLTIRAKLNGALMSSLVSALGNVSSVAGLVDVSITVRTIGETGTVSCFVGLQLDEKVLNANNSSVVLDSTSGSDLVITAQWSSANAGNSAILDQACLEALG